MHLCGEGVRGDGGRRGGGVLSSGKCGKIGPKNDRTFAQAAEVNEDLTARISRCPQNRLWPNIDRRTEYSVDRQWRNDDAQCLIWILWIHTGMSGLRKERRCLCTKSYLTVTIPLQFLLTSLKSVHRLHEKPLKYRPSRYYKREKGGE